VSLSRTGSTKSVQTAVDPVNLGNWSNFRPVKLATSWVSSSSREWRTVDDFGMVPLDDFARRDLLEVLDDRYQRRATLVTSQIPTDHWHELIGDPTFGDAILDRLFHNAHRITLKGASGRRVYDSTKGKKDEEKQEKTTDTN